MRNYIVLLSFLMLVFNTYNSQAMEISDEAKRLTKLADLGDIHAQADPGWLYRIGVGVPQDFDKDSTNLIMNSTLILTCNFSNNIKVLS